LAGKETLGQGKFGKPDIKTAWKRCWYNRSASVSLAVARAPSLRTRGAQ